MRNHWYLLATAVLAVGLLIWFAFAAHLRDAQLPASASAQNVDGLDLATSLSVSAESAASDHAAGDSVGGYSPLVIAIWVTVFVAVAVGMILLARLQRRRLEAYREVQRQAREKARTSGKGDMDIGS